MKNEIEIIMENYKKGIKQIDDKYKVREVKPIDTKELDEKIEYEKSFIEELQYEGESIKEESIDQSNEKLIYKSNKELIDRSKERLEVALKERQQMQDKYDKAIEKRQQKLEEMKKLKNSTVKLKSGREVTQNEKDNMDKEDLKNKAIRELVQESQKISQQLMEKSKELEAKRKEWNDFKYEFEKDENGNLKSEPTNRAIVEKIHKEYDDIKKQMTELSKMQEECNKYLEELKQPSKEVEKINELLKNEYNKQEETKQSKEEKNLENNSNKKPENKQEQNEEIEENKEIEEQQNEEKMIFGQRQGEQQENLNKETNKDFLSITINNKAKISIGKNKFKVGSKKVKQGVNLSDKEVSEILDTYIFKQEEKILAKELIRTNVMDKTILNVIHQSKINYSGKRELINSYLNKCLVPEDEKNMDVVYDAKALSRVNIFNRIFRREMNNEEKNELLIRAKKAEEMDIARVKGEYKIKFGEKIFGIFGGTLRLPEASEAQIEEAYKHNEKINFKRSMKVEENEKVNDAGRQENTTDREEEQR